MKDTSSAYIIEAEKFKWCMHVLGPDEIIAMPDYKTACEQAELINQALNRRQRDENDPAIFCCAAPWNGTWAEHAAELVRLTEQERKERAAVAQRGHDTDNAHGDQST